MNPSTNKVFKNVLAKRQGCESGRGTHIGLTDTSKAVHEEVIPESVEPTTIVMSSPNRLPTAPTSEPHDKKKRKKRSLPNAPQTIHPLSGHPSVLRRQPPSKKWPLPSTFSIREQ